MTASFFEGYLFLKAPPEKDAKGKAATATWKKRFHRIRLNDNGAPIMECFREVDTARSYAVCTFKLAELMAVDGLAEEKYKGKSRFDMVLVTNMKKKKVSMLAENVSTRDQWVFQINKLISTYNASASSSPLNTPEKVSASISHESDSILQTPPRGRTSSNHLSTSGDIPSPGLKIPATPLDSSSHYLAMDNETTHSSVNKRLGLKDQIETNGRNNLGSILARDDSNERNPSTVERQSSSAPRPSSPSSHPIKNTASMSTSSPPINARRRSDLSLSSSTTDSLQVSKLTSPGLPSPRRKLGNSFARSSGGNSSSSSMIDAMKTSEDMASEDLTRFEHEEDGLNIPPRGRGSLHSSRHGILSSQNQVSRSPSPQIRKPAEEKLWGGDGRGGVTHKGGSPSRKLASPRRNYVESLVAEMESSPQKASSATLSSSSQQDISSSSGQEGDQLTPPPPPPPKKTPPSSPAKDGDQNSQLSSSSSSSPSSSMPSRSHNANSMSPPSVAETKFDQKIGHERKSKKSGGSKRSSHLQHSAGQRPPSPTNHRETSRERNRSSPSRPLSLRKSLLQRFTRSSSSQERQEKRERGERDPSPCLSISSDHSDTSQTSVQSSGSFTSYASRVGAAAGARRDKGNPLPGPNSSAKNNQGSTNSSPPSSQKNQAAHKRSDQQDADEDVEEEEEGVLATSMHKLALDSRTRSGSGQRYASPSHDHPGDASRGRGRLRESEAIASSSSSKSKASVDLAENTSNVMSTTQRNLSPMSKWPNWSRKKRPSSPSSGGNEGSLLNSSTPSPFRMLVSRRSSSRNASPSPARSVASSQGSFASSKGSSNRKLSWAPEEDPRLLAEWKKLLGCNENDVALAVTAKLLSSSRGGMYDKWTSIANEVQQSFTNDVALLAAALDLDTSEHGTEVLLSLKPNSQAVATQTINVEEEDNDIAMYNKLGSSVKLFSVYEKLLKLHESRELRRFNAKKKWLEGPGGNQKKEVELDTHISCSNALNYSTKLALFMVAHQVDELDQPERPSPNTFSRRRKPSPPPPPTDKKPPPPTDKKAGDVVSAAAAVLSGEDDTSAAKTNGPVKKESKSSKQKKERLLQLNQHLSQHATGSFRENENPEYNSALFDFFSNTDTVVMTSRSIAPISVAGGVLRFKHVNVKYHTVAKHACNTISNAYLCLYGQNVVLDDEEEEEEETVSSIGSVKNSNEDDSKRLSRSVGYISAGLSGTRLDDSSMKMARAFICDELSSNGSLVVALSAIVSALITYLSSCPPSTKEEDEMKNEKNGDSSIASKKSMVVSKSQSIDSFTEKDNESTLIENKKDVIVSLTCNDILDHVSNLDDKWLNVDTLKSLLRALATLVISPLPWDPIRRGSTLLMLFVECNDEDESEVLTLEILLKCMMVTSTSDSFHPLSDKFLLLCNPFNDQLSFNKVIDWWLEKKSKIYDQSSIVTSDIEDKPIFPLDTKDYDGRSALMRCDNSGRGYFRDVLIKCGASSDSLNKMDVNYAIMQQDEKEKEHEVSESLSNFDDLFANREWKVPSKEPAQKKETDLVNHEYESETELSAQHQEGDKKGSLSKAGEDIDGELEGFLNSLYDDLDDSRGVRSKEEELLDEDVAEEDIEDIEDAGELDEHDIGQDNRPDDGVDGDREEVDDEEDIDEEDRDMVRSLRHGLTPINTSREGSRNVPTTPPSEENSPRQKSPATPTSPKSLTFITSSQQASMNHTTLQQALGDENSQVLKPTNESGRGSVMRGILETDDEIASIMDPEVYELTPNDGKLKRMPLPPSTPPPDDDQDEENSSSISDPSTVTSNTKKNSNFKHIDPKNKDGRIRFASDDGKLKRMPLPPSTPPPDDDQNEENADTYEVASGHLNSPISFSERKSTISIDEKESVKEEVNTKSIDTTTREMLELTSSVEELLWSKAEEETLQEARKAAIEIKSSQHQTTHKRPHVARKNKHHSNESTTSSSHHHGPPPPPPLPPPRAPSRTSGVATVPFPSSSPSPPPLAETEEPSSIWNELIGDTDKWLELENKLKCALKQVEESATREREMESQLKAATLSLEEKQDEILEIQRRTENDAKEKYEEELSLKIKTMQAEAQNSTKALKLANEKLEEKFLRLDSVHNELKTQHKNDVLILEDSVNDLSQENERLKQDKNELYSKIESLNSLLTRQGDEFEEYKKEIETEIEIIKQNASSKQLANELQEKEIQRYAELEAKFNEDLSTYKKTCEMKAKKEQEERELETQGLKLEFIEVLNLNKDMMAQQEEHKELINNLTDLVEKQNEDILEMKKIKEVNESLLLEKNSKIESLNNDFFNLELKVTTQKDTFSKFKKFSQENETKLKNEIIDMKSELILLKDKLKRLEKDSSVKNEEVGGSFIKHDKQDESLIENSVEVTIDTDLSKTKESHVYGNLAASSNTIINHNDLDDFDLELEPIDSLNVQPQTVAVAVDEEDVMDQSDRKEETKVKEEKEVKDELKGSKAEKQIEESLDEEIEKILEVPSSTPPPPFLDKEKKSLSIVQANRLAFEKQAQANALKSSMLQTTPPTPPPPPPSRKNNFSRDGQEGVSHFRGSASASPSKYKSSSPDPKLRVRTKPLDDSHWIGNRKASNYSSEKQEPPKSPTLSSLLSASSSPVQKRDSTPIPPASPSSERGRSFSRSKNIAAPNTSPPETPGMPPGPPPPRSGSGSVQTHAERSLVAKASALIRAAEMKALEPPPPPPPRRSTSIERSIQMSEQEQHMMDEEEKRKEAEAAKAEAEALAKLDAASMNKSAQGSSKEKLSLSAFLQQVPAEKVRAPSPGHPRINR